MTQSLCRGNCTDPQTIIFAGNGCIQWGNKSDGWDIIEEFLINAERICESIDPELFLLQCAEDLRFYVQHAMNSLKVKGYVKPDEPYPWMPGLLHDRYQVAKAYSSDQLEVINKPEIIEEALKRDDTCVITSNWDKALWHDKNIRNLCHIHGLCDIHQSLILPTETFSESYSLLKEFNRASKKIYDLELLEFFRKRISSLKNAEECAVEWIFSPNVETIILWGMHLHIYDAEIISKILDLKRRTTEEKIDQITSGGLILSPIKKVHVVNPNKKALRRAGSIFFENLFTEDGFTLNHIDPTTGTSAKISANDIEKLEMGC